MVYNKKTGQLLHKHSNKLIVLISTNTFYKNKTFKFATTINKTDLILFKIIK